MSQLKEKDSLDTIKDESNSSFQVSDSSQISTDVWTIKDELNVKNFVYTLSDFLIHGKIRTPLCISIQAPWGGGKTSLMKMIQQYYSFRKIIL